MKFRPSWHNDGLYSIEFFAFNRKKHLSILKVNVDFFDYTSRISAWLVVKECS